MRRMLFYALVSLAFFLVAATQNSCKDSDNTVVLSADDVPTVLVDPGHGGMDGGAVASDGTLEKHINLAIGTDLYDLFVLWGYPVCSTRLSDVSIHDADAVGTRQIKVSDMHNRLEMYEDSDVIISLHQNHFSVEKYHGTQVFYSVNHPLSMELATAVRESIVTRLQRDNMRELKSASDGIYLLHHTSRPSILVECGFLSNHRECAMLKDSLYQQQMAFCIFEGFIKCQPSIGEE